ncbi:MAG: hypothetical protein V1804_04795 [Patescibacteria group bacterium]
MVNLGKNNIKNLIIDSLSCGSEKATDVVEIIKSTKPSTTKQAVYLALRNLIKEEVVIKYSKKVMLNQVWINQLNEFVSKVDKNYLENYRGSKMKNELDKMAEGDRIIYLFKKLDSFDSFWNHIFSLIIKKTNILAPLYLYNPHEWFLFAREKSEKYMYNWIKKNKPKTFYAIGGNNILDIAMRKKYSSELIEFSTGEKMGFENNYYLAILGNYLIETFLEKKLADRINIIYNKFEKEKDASDEIRKIMDEKSKFKIVVSVSSDKARKLKRRFEKIFFIPADIKNL